MRKYLASPDAQSRFDGLTSAAPHPSAKGAQRRLCEHGDEGLLDVGLTSRHAEFGSDQLFTRSVLTDCARASCTDDTGNRTDCTSCAGIILRVVPRTVPRERRAAAGQQPMAITQRSVNSPQQLEDMIRQNGRWICRAPVHRAPFRNWVAASLLPVAQLEGTKPRAILQAIACDRLADSSPQVTHVGSGDATNREQSATTASHGFTTGHGITFYHDDTSSSISESYLGAARVPSRSVVRGCGGEGRQHSGGCRLRHGLLHCTRSEACRILSRTGARMRHICGPYRVALWITGARPDGCFVYRT